MDRRSPTEKPLTQEVVNFDALAEKVSEIYGKKIDRLKVRRIYKGWDRNKTISDIIAQLLGKNDPRLIKQA